MQYIQDIIGSIIVGGIIMVMLLKFNANIMEGAATQTFTTTVQKNVTTVTDILEYDFRKMGYHVPVDSTVVVAETSRIVFKGDFDNDGSTDVLSYYLDTSSPSGHVNPRARILYRKLNTQPAQSINLGITRFRLWYYNLKGSPADSTYKIRSVKVVLRAESISPYDTTYSGAYWERIIKPQNLVNL